MTVTVIHSLIRARHVLYGALFLFAALTLITASVLIDQSMAQFGDYFYSSAELIAASILVLVVLAPVHFFYHIKSTTPSNIGHLASELILLSITWLLFVGGAGSISSAAKGFTESCYYIRFCPALRATQAFAWLTWITTSALILIDMLYGFSANRSGVWRERVSTGNVGEEEFTNATAMTQSQTMSGDVSHTQHTRVATPSQSGLPPPVTV